MREMTSRVLALPTGGIVMDIETAGFTGHIQGIIAVEMKTAQVYEFAQQPGYLPLADIIPVMQAANFIVGHNILAFDLPRIAKYLGASIDRTKVVDTLLATRILWPDLRDSDIAAGIIPSSEYGKHSLRAWGHRLGVHKGDFADWYRWSPELMRYCLRDVITSWTLYEHIRDEADRLAV